MQNWILTNNHHPITTPSPLIFHHPFIFLHEFNKIIVRNYIGGALYAEWDTKEHLQSEQMKRKQFPLLNTDILV